MPASWTQTKQALPDRSSIYQYARFFDGYGLRMTIVFGAGIWSASIYDPLTDAVISSPEPNQSLLDVVHSAYSDVRKNLKEHRAAAGAPPPEFIPRDK